MIHLSQAAVPGTPPLRSAPARWYFADTPAQRPRTFGPGSLGR